MKVLAAYAVFISLLYLMIYALVSSIPSNEVRNNQVCQLLGMDATVIDYDHQNKNSVYFLVSTLHNGSHIVNQSSLKDCK